MYLTFNFNFLTVEGGGAFAKGEKMWLHGSHVIPTFFQPKMVVDMGAMINFEGLNVSPARLALDRTSKKCCNKSSSLSAST